MDVTEASSLVVVANRLPVKPADDGSWEASPGGLVRALLPVLRHRTGSWIGWSGDAGDAPDAFSHDGVDLVPIGMNEDEKAAFYEGFANETIWPLYHDAIRPSPFDQGWWDTYVLINERFAQAAADHAAPGAAVWVQDYHLQLVPRMLRRMRPDVRIGFFLHIPFPPQEIYTRLPWREELLRGVLGADVVGFQSATATDNFVSACRKVIDAQGDADALVVLDIDSLDGQLPVERTVRAGTFPISIDVDEIDVIARSPRCAARALEIRAELGDPEVVLLGVDRLDYTKGIDVRLEAYRTLLAEGRIDVEQCVMVQVAVPTRGGIDDYVEEKRRVEELVGEINGEFGSLSRTPVHYLHQSFELDELVALYRAGDVMLVTPLRDGMNLVAKEYAASRVDERGVLVLSEFAGAADELLEAILVNPHDRDAVARAIVDAIAMDDVEAHVRMKQLRDAVRTSDVRFWADSFLDALDAVSLASTA